MNSRDELLKDNYWDDFEERVNETILSLKDGLKPSLKRLTVHITESCNFRCEYCNMCFNKTQRTMDFELAKKITKEYAEANGSTIHFTGGEPTIVPYFEELCAYAKSLGLKVSSNTNAFKYVDVKNIDKLKTSFDTPFKNVTDSIVNVNGAFDTIVANMKDYSIKMKDKMLSITAVLNRNTYKDMLELAKFVNENFSVYNLYFSNYKGTDPNMAFTDSEIEDMFTNYIPKVKEFFLETENEYSFKQLDLYKPSDFIALPDRFEQNKTIPCYIQLSEMTIDVDGSCHNCSHNFRDGYKPYNVNVSDRSLVDCFNEIKENLNGNWTNISKHCLSGCNCNLMGFNRAVHKGELV